MIAERLRRTAARNSVVRATLTRALRQRRFPGVAVLCYHALRGRSVPAHTMAFEGLHVRTDDFEMHCQLLAEHCHPVSLDQWRAAGADRRALPDRPVLVTFDDGYRSVLTEAAPMLERYRVPAVVFLCTEPIERGEMFWYDAVARNDNEVTARDLKSKPYDDWMRAVAASRTPIDSEDPHAPLTVAEVARLAAMPRVEIGGHSHRHPILAHADRETQQHEIATNVERLQTWTGRRIRAFAYPNGRQGLDYNDVTKHVLREAGIETAFSTSPGFALLDGDALDRSRFLMTAGVEAGILLHRLARVWH